MEKETLNEEFEALDELHKNELDDIVLEKYEKKEKLKKYAIVAGSLIAFFFVIIMIVKVVSDSSSAPQESLVEEQIVQNEEPQATSDEEFEEVPIVTQDENVSDEESLDNVIQEVLQKEQTLAQNEKSVSHPTKATKKSVKKTESKPKSPVKEKKSVQISKQSTKSNTVKPQKTKKKTTITATGHYFIQVGAFLKHNPDKRFLNKIESNGFSYVVKTFHKDGKTIKRVYIGPFGSKSEARKALAKVKRSISNGAFIVRL